MSELPPEIGEAPTYPPMERRTKRTSCLDSMFILRTLTEKYKGLNDAEECSVKDCAAYLRQVTRAEGWGWMDNFLVTFIDS